MAENETIEVSDVKISIAQVTDSVTVQVASGRYSLTPQKTMTGYQSLRIATLLTILSNQRSWLPCDDLFAKVYAETAEHWTKLDEVKT